MGDTFLCAWINVQVGILTGLVQVNKLAKTTSLNAPGIWTSNPSRRISLSTHILSKGAIITAIRMVLLLIAPCKFHGPEIYMV